MYVVYKGKVPGVYDDWRSVGDRFTVSAVIVTTGTPLGRRRKLDTRAI